MRPITALIIMDGFGCRESIEGNAIKLAGTPHIDALTRSCPHTMIGASGLDVGLPDGQMGNSEVGHLNIGAGRIVYQELTRITKAIEDGDFFENPSLIKAMDTAKERGAALHLMGLLSDGGVHSHITHLEALAKMAAQRGLDKIFIHCFMDGRDTPPQSGKGYIEQLEAQLPPQARIATVTGRYFAMDRDNRWERVEKAYRALTLGEGRQCESAAQAMEQSYSVGETDEFITPTVIMRNGAPAACIKDGDSIIFFNFRPDRARELTRAFTQECGFERERIDTAYVCMTQYDAAFTGVDVAFPPHRLSNTLGEYLAKSGITQVRLAETEKYAHVTFFFNGGVEAPNDEEDRVLIPSPKVATYDLKPEMSAKEVTEAALEIIKSGKYDVLIMNFANADMVGHTGVLEAAEKAVATVDECVGSVAQAILAAGGQALITADHGNAEQMTDENGGAFTAHTTGPVPFIVLGEKWKNARIRSGGILADVAPTMLKMMDIEKPQEMTGSSLITN